MLIHTTLLCDSNLYLFFLDTKTGLGNRCDIPRSLSQNGQSKRGEDCNPVRGPSDIPNIILPISFLLGFGLYVDEAVWMRDLEEDIKS